MAGHPPSVQRSTVVAAPRSRVWTALTDARELSRWFGADVELDLRPGGHGRFVDGRGARAARVTGVREGRRLDLEWWPEGADPDEDASSVTFEVEDDPAGTRVVVTETAPPRLAVSAAWTARADRLEAHLQGVFAGV